VRSAKIAKNRNILSRILGRDRKFDINSFYFIFHFDFLACRELRERTLEDDVDMSMARTPRGNRRDAGLLDETKITVSTSRRARVPLAGREIYCVYRCAATHWFYFDVNVNSVSRTENEEMFTYRSNVIRDSRRSFCKCERIMRAPDTSILIGRVSARLSDAVDVELHVTAIDRMTMIFRTALKDRCGMWRLCETT